MLGRALEFLPPVDHIGIFAQCGNDELDPCLLDGLGDFQPQSVNPLAEAGSVGKDTRARLDEEGAKFVFIGGLRLVAGDLSLFILLVQSLDGIDKADKSDVLPAFDKRPGVPSVLKVCVRSGFNGEH